MTKHISFSRNLDQRVMDALLNALEIGLDEVEYEIAREALCELDAAFECAPPDLAERLVTEFEKSLGLGLDEAQFGTAVGAIRKLLPRAIPQLPTYAPDAFLEAVYEDQVTRDYYD